MILNGKCVFLGKEEGVNKHGDKYYIARFTDNSGKTFETMTKDINVNKQLSNLIQFKSTEIFVDVKQGKYTSINLISAIQNEKVS